MHLLDYIVLSVILLWLIAAVCYIIRQKKAGRRFSCSGCSSGSPNCAGCPKAGAHHGVK